MILAADVADDDAVRLPAEVRRAESEHHRDLCARELLGHRRIDCGVRATDLVARFLPQARECAHAGPRDGDEVHPQAARDMARRSTRGQPVTSGCGDADTWRAT